MRSIAFIGMFLLILTSPALCQSSRSFDGSNDKVQFSNPWNNYGNDATAIVWYKTTQTSQGHLISANDASANRWNLAIDDEGDNLFFFFNNGSSGSIVKSANTTNDGAWHWGAFVRSGDDFMLYEDGVEVGTSFTKTGNLNNVSNLNYGEALAGTFDYNGQLAYGQLFDRALSLPELIQAARCPGSITGSRFHPLWGADSPEVDLSGNGATGTVSGATSSTDGPPISFCGGSK